MYAIVDVNTGQRCAVKIQLDGEPNIEVAPLVALTVERVIEYGVLVEGEPCMPEKLTPEEMSKFHVIEFFREDNPKPYYPQIKGIAAIVFLNEDDAARTARSWVGKCGVVSAKYYPLARAKVFMGR